LTGTFVSLQDLETQKQTMKYWRDVVLVNITEQVPAQCTDPRRTPLGVCRARRPVTLARSRVACTLCPVVRKAAVALGKPTFIWQAAVPVRRHMNEHTTVVAVHVRRGDYVSKSKKEVHGALGKDYYRDSWYRIQGRIGLNHPQAAENIVVLVFAASNSIEWARAELKDTFRGAKVVSLRACRRVLHIRGVMARRMCCCLQHAAREDRGRRGACEAYRPLNPPPNPLSRSSRL